MKVIGIIPARMASSRFPGKPMEKIFGIPMIGHCYLRSSLNKKIDTLYVATPDKQIYDYIKKIKGNVVMTSHKHEMCNDRVFEAVDKIEKKLKFKHKFIINIQGDLPLVFPSMIDQLLQPLIKDKNVSNVTMVELITSIKEFKDLNRIKVVFDKFNNALLLTREPVPSDFKSKFSNFKSFKHVALRAYNREIFEKLKKIKMTKLEKVEGIDDLRLLENDIKINVVITKKITETVDNLQDLKKVKKMMKNDILRKKFNKFIL